ncbi:hypothetical protein J5N97_013551 [Dioscorea zingiberensis]|uniref:Uncharacterized protein n=1 Tax=Dioscorea zingiberensis TaxID=325984 RepID=A0A9D5HJ75_9LILI|nr:hypothetical protein J5N97_013551 [Dioscorea zingiberensis]
MYVPPHLGRQSSSPLVGDRYSLTGRNERRSWRVSLRCLPLLHKALSRPNEGTEVALGMPLIGRTDVVRRRGCKPARRRLNGGGRALARASRAWVVLGSVPASWPLDARWGGGPLISHWSLRPGIAAESHKEEERRFGVTPVLCPVVVATRVVGVIGDLVRSSPNIKKEDLLAGALQPVIGLLSFLVYTFLFLDAMFCLS